MSDENEDTDNLLVIQEQPRTEIYWGRHGHLVINQPDSILDGEGLVIFTPGAVPELTRLLQREYDCYVAEFSLGQPAPMPPPQAVSAAPAKKKGRPAAD